MILKPQEGLARALLALAPQPWSLQEAKQWQHWALGSSTPSQTAPYPLVILDGQLAST